MNQLQNLRESYKMSVRDLSHMTGISPLKISRAEQSLRVLDARERKRLAHVFGVSEDLLRETPVIDPRRSSVTSMFLAAFRRRMFIVLIMVLVGAAVMLAPRWIPVSRASTAIPEHTTPQALTQPTSGSTNTWQKNHGNAAISLDAMPIQTHPQASGRGGIRSDWALYPTAAPSEVMRPTHTPEPTATPEPTPTSIPGMVLAADGPHGCPLQPVSGRVVLTQGYGVGTHEPSEKWGAVDLAVAAPGETIGSPVVATHSGTARVLLDSFPGGNQLSVVSSTGWRTNYAHLSEVLVKSGEPVQAGQIIGLAGNTGKSTGPHLDYQVWYGATNVDPTDLVQSCW